MSNSMVVNPGIQFNRALYESDRDSWLKDVGDKIEERELKLDVPGAKGEIVNGDQLVNFANEHGISDSMVQALDDIVNTPSMQLKKGTIDVKLVCEKLGIDSSNTPVSTGEAIKVEDSSLFSRFAGTLKEGALKAVEHTIVPLIQRDVGSGGQEALNALQGMQFKGKPVLECVLGKKSNAFLRGEQWIKNNLNESKFPPAPPYENWEAKSQRIHNEVLPSVAGLPLTEQIEKLCNVGGPGRDWDTKFVDDNFVKLLVNGEMGFEDPEFGKYAAIDRATDSIKMMSWAFYDDETGNKMADKLIDASKRGVDVKVIVDGQIAEGEHHHEMFDRMRDAGVQVMGFRNPERLNDGNHRKMLVIDGQEAVMGGQNIGDMYSRAGEISENKFRDTDIYSQGPVVEQVERAFCEVWNDQIDWRLGKEDEYQLPAGIGTDDKVAPISFDPSKATRQAADGGESVAFVNHVAGADENCLRAVVAMIESAEHAVDISQAYFFELPPIQEALYNALDRGVPVRIFMNGDESMDMPALAGLQLQAAAKLAEKGAEVFVKRGDPDHGTGRKGDMLHNKVVLVDSREVQGKENPEDSYLSIGSWNMHARSVQFEGEDMAVIHSKQGAAQNTTGQMQEAFDNDIKENGIKMSARLLNKIADNNSLNNKVLGLIFENL